MMTMMITIMVMMMMIMLMMMIIIMMYWAVRALDGLQDMFLCPKIGLSRGYKSMSYCSWIRASMIHNTCSLAYYSVPWAMELVSNRIENTQ